MKLRRIINTDYFYVPLLAFWLVIFLYYYSSKISDFVWGAILASLVGFSTYWVQRLAETSRKRYDTLVYLEQELNTALSDLSINESMIRGAVKERGMPLIRPHTLQIEENHIREIGRPELKNILFSLSLEFGRYNNGFEIAITAYEKEVVRINGTLAEYGRPKANTMLEEAKKNFKSGLGRIQQYGDGLTNEIKDALARVRFFLKNDRSRILQHITTKYYDKQEYENSVKIERKELEKEISSGREQSRNRDKKGKNEGKRD